MGKMEAVGVAKQVQQGSKHERRLGAHRRDDHRVSELWSDGKQRCDFQAKVGARTETKQEVAWTSAGFPTRVLIAMEMKGVAEVGSGADRSEFELEEDGDGAANGDSGQSC